MVMGEETLETEVAIIGGGPGGYAAAFRAADLGLDVTLINAEEKLGGVCLRRGCIPTKAYLQAARVLAEAKQAADWGIDFGDPAIDIDRLRGWQQEVVDRLTGGLGRLAKAREVNVIQARAVFEGEHMLRLEGADIAHVKFEKAIIATGSLPVPLPGVDFDAGGRLMAADDALDLPEVPETLLVVGGGYIGLELGMVYAALGSRVTLLEMADGLLPGLDRELVRPLAQRVEERFEAVRLQTRVTALQVEEDGVIVTLEGEEGEEGQEQRFERALVAIGRRPNTDGLALDKAGVERNDQGYIQVDERRRTSAADIFAIGDAAGEPLLAHKAMHEGKVAAEVIAGQPAAFDARCVPAVVYTDPEIAWCGLQEEEARKKEIDVEVGRFPWRASGRALTQGAGEGLTKLIFAAGSGRLLGVGIVGEGAEDLIAEGVLAIEMGAVAEDLALTIHPHPTLAETTGEAAEAFLGLVTHILPEGS